MAYADETLTYFKNLKLRVRGVLKDVAALDDWDIYTYRHFSPGGPYLCIWHGPATYYQTPSTSQWVTKSMAVRVDIIGLFTTSGYKTEEASDAQNLVDDIIPTIELTLLSAFLDSQLTSTDYTAAPLYISAVSPEITSDSGELTVRAAAVNGQVIGETLSFNVDIQLKVTGG